MNKKFYVSLTFRRFLFVLKYFVFRRVIFSLVGEDLTYLKLVAFYELYQVFFGIVLHLGVVIAVNNYPWLFNSNRFKNLLFIFELFNLLHSPVLAGVYVCAGLTRIIADFPVCRVSRSSAFVQTGYSRSSIYTC